MNIDSRLLLEYMQGFVGFGSFDADFWFVGMEQGGGETLEELSRRVSVWDQFGRPNLTDLRSYHEAIGDFRWYGVAPRIQPTWDKIIRLVLAARRSEVSTTLIRSYQVDSFARSSGETLITELLPLPSRSIGDWIYGQLDSIPMLVDRETYSAEMTPYRIQMLRQHIERCAPAAVVFLGKSYTPYWEAIAGTSLQETRAGVILGRRADTNYVVVRHPTSYGVTNQYFEEIGSMLAT
jgi:hypothetical protein